MFEYCFLLIYCQESTEALGWCTIAVSLGHHESCMLKQVEASSRPTGAKRRGAMFHCGAVQTPLSLSLSQRLALSSAGCLPTPLRVDC